MKAKQRRPAQHVSLYMDFDSPTVIRALTRMAVAFPFKARRAKLRHLRKEMMMADRLVHLALAHIEVLAPRFHAMIDYCEAEGMDQTEYLESLIRAKFAKNLHRGRDDDDNDGGSPTDNEPAPTLPAQTLK